MQLQKDINDNIFNSLKSLIYLPSACIFTIMTKVETFHTFYMKYWTSIYFYLEVKLLKHAAKIPSEMMLRVDIPNGQLLLMKPTKDNLEQTILMQDKSKLIVQSQVVRVRAMIIGV